jgi:membrane-associated protein
MFDIAHIIQSGGLLLIAIIVFAESGMFVGFFLPGDTLLLTAGVFAAQGKLSLVAVIIIIALAAIAGDNLGYLIGKRYGRHLFEKEDGIFFSKEHLHQAELFFKRFGNKTMMLSHFVPIVRTFAPPVAGAAHMPRRKFVPYDAIGCTSWAIIVTLVGYWFGSKIPNIDHYILIAVAAIMLITLGPSVWHVHKAVRQKSARKKAAKKTDE